MTLTHFELDWLIEKILSMTPWYYTESKQLIAKYYIFYLFFNVARYFGIESNPALSFALLCALEAIKHNIAFILTALVCYWRNKGVHTFQFLFQL